LNWDKLQNLTITVSLYLTTGGYLYKKLPPSSQINCIFLFDILPNVGHMYPQEMLRGPCVSFPQSISETKKLYKLIPTINISNIESNHIFKC
jgi:hypothetical protein